MTGWHHRWLWCCCLHCSQNLPRRTTEATLTVWILNGGESIVQHNLLQTLQTKPCIWRYEVYRSIFFPQSHKCCIFMTFFDTLKLSHGLQMYYSTYRLCAGKSATIHYKVVNSSKEEGSPLKEGACTIRWPKECLRTCPHNTHNNNSSQTTPSSG